MAGTTALVAILGIMVVLIAVLALVVVNALAASPWGVVTIGLTIPIALLMGVHLRWLRPGRVLEASAIGLVLLVAALYAGRWVASQPELAAHATLTRPALAIAIMVYGFAASVLPVWLLLAPRDYLSAFVKIGVVLALAVGIIVVAAAAPDAGTHPLRAWRRSRSSRGRFSRSRSSRSRAARSPASTRSSRPARPPSCSHVKATHCS